jgi:hypothetical protein
MQPQEPGSDDSLEETWQMDTIGSLREDFLAYILSVESKETNKV